tara:strand:+ start:173 stop:736 length:564 start_codon:yes stop_codon:yes gene_type:complete
MKQSPTPFFTKKLINGVSVNTYQDINFLAKRDIIFDVDGTLMNISERLTETNKRYDKKDQRDKWWDMFLNNKVMKDNDTCNIDVVLMLHCLMDKGNRIIITSARNIKHKATTIWQLENHCGLTPDLYKIYLRKDNDMRPDSIVKKELLEQIKTDGYDPTIAFDDRDQVVKMWRELGLICYQVREGSF